MKLSCPRCDNSTDLDKHNELKTFDIRGERLSVPFEFYTCRKCGEEFFVPTGENDPLAAAYREYRSLHSMLQPEEIRGARAKYGITQAELAGLLGLGAVTLSRYETGQLQSETHDKLLRLAIDPPILRNLVNKSEGVLSPQRKREVLAAVEKEEPAVRSLQRYICDTFRGRDADEFSGDRSFKLDKFVNAILFLCQDWVPKTKLNKLLFYCDFLHYRHHQASITGAQYAHMPYGPTPDIYDLYFPLLVKQKLLDTDEREYKGFQGERSVFGEVYKAIAAPDVRVFDNEELDTLLFVRRQFENMSAGQLSGRSHEEKGYRETPQSELISYRYAKDLSISKK